MSNTGKQGVVFVLISSLVLLIVIFSFSYAFFTANTSQSNPLLVTASISNDIVPIFTATSSGDLTLTVTDADMLSGSADNSTTSLTANQTITVSLLGGSSSNQASCSFSFTWTNLGTTYTPTSGIGALKEYTLKIVDSNSTPVVNETNISNLTSGGVIKSGLSITSNGAQTNKVYTVIVSVYNLNMAQTINNNTYSSRVSVTNVSC